MTSLNMQNKIRDETISMIIQNNIFKATYTHDTKKFFRV